MRVPKLVMMEGRRPSLLLSARTERRFVTAGADLTDFERASTTVALSAADSAGFARIPAKAFSFERVALMDARPFEVASRADSLAAAVYYINMSAKMTIFKRLKLRLSRIHSESAEKMEENRESGKETHESRGVGSVDAEELNGGCSCGSGRVRAGNGAADKRRSTGKGSRQHCW